MLTDPIMALRLAEERQAKLRCEAETDRLIAQQRGLRTRWTSVGRSYLLRLSDLLLVSGLWLRSRVERQTSAAAVPASHWHAIPLMTLRLIGDQATGASLRWWPIYMVGLPWIGSASGYAIIPAAWLARADVR
jgi:hypothetical protein